MHIPDGFVDIPTSVAFGAVAAAGVGICLRRARHELDERTAPMAGLVAAFVFAVQALNFPIGAGTSGHLLGGALAAVLVGPWTGALCVTVVLTVQALFFADGGLSAIGLNVTNMALVTTAAGWLLFLALRKVLPSTRRSVAGATFVAALVSVPLSALAFVGQYAMGGTAEVPLATLTTAMVGVHVAIGVGEGLISALTVASVMAVRPDLVYGARHLVPSLTLRTAPEPTAAPSAG